MSVDMDEFHACMQEQKDRARSANASETENAWGTYDGTTTAILEQCGTTAFVGYEANEAVGKVVAILAEGKRVDCLQAGQSGQVFLDMTPFYAEMGGQVGDTGTLSSAGMLAQVTDTKAPEKGLHAHAVTVVEGTIAVGDEVTASIDVMRRERIRRNHTATHILHWALREVLGTHVKQAGSLVAPDHLRFDFTHFAACTPEELAEVERLANAKIVEAHPVETYESSLTAAREAGVTALFGEKYGEVVRVVDADGFSRELCGGTHVRNTVEIGLVKIVSEGAVGANLRRIEAVTSMDAIKRAEDMEGALKQIAGTLNCRVEDVPARVDAATKRIKELTASVRKAMETANSSDTDALVSAVVKGKGGFPVLIARVDGQDMSGLRNRWDMLRSKLPSAAAVVLFGVVDGKPQIVAAGTDAAVEAGFDATKVIKTVAPYIHGGGGGRAGMATAGGKDASGIDAVGQAARELLL